MNSNLLLVAALCSASTISLAGITPVRRDSSIKLVVWTPLDNSLLYPLMASSDFEPFVASYDSDTMQSSSVSAAGATYAGGSGAQSHGSPASGSFTLSTFRYTFEVTSPVSFQVDGSLESTFSGRTLLTLKNTGVTPERTISASSNNSAPFDSTPVHWAGELEAGTYLLTLDEGNSIHVNAPPGTRTVCNFVLTFTNLACPSDLNFDNAIDDADFQVFAADYSRMTCPESPVACPSDFNHDTFVDDVDFQSFLAAYDAVLCP